MRTFFERNQKGLCLFLVMIGVLNLVLLGYNSIGMYDFNNYFLN